MSLTIEDFEKLNLKAGFLSNEPMSRHTTFRTGGPARIFAAPEDAGALAEIVAVCRAAEEPYTLIGRGSNTLVSDKGYDGVVICLAENFGRTTVSPDGFDALAGTSLAALAAVARRAGLTGMEFASGIPGTLGGAIAMNAGAYGSEMKDIVKNVTVMDQEGTLLTYAGEDMHFGYRKSRIQEESLIVVSARLELKAGDKLQIGRRMNELMTERRKKQPLEYASAGSTFKRPEGNFAGALIQQAGLGGYSIGDAQVSEKHCGFIINRGGATSSEVYALCKYVQQVVYEKSGVMLEMEVKLLGNFD